MAREFVHLHLHSSYSVLDAYGLPGAIVAEAARRNLSALALTDHGTLGGTYEFYWAAKQAGVHPLLGMEAYIVPSAQPATATEKRGRPRLYHCGLLAESMVGWKNLLRLNALAHEQFYYRPHITVDQLFQHHEGLVCLSGCLSSLAAHAVQGNGDGRSVAQVLGQFRAVFGDRLYAEIMPHDMEGFRQVNPAVVRAATSLGITVVATNDVHYLRQGDETTHEVILAIQSHAYWDDPKRWKYDVTGLFLRGWEEMEQGFFQAGHTAVLGERTIQAALATTQEVADRCQVALLKTVRFQEIVPALWGDDRTAAQELWRQAREGMTQLGLRGHDRYEARLRYECDIVFQMGFTNYFLVTADIVRYAKAQGILVGPGRGSSAGSLLAWVLGITAIDPLRFNLPFERFISPDRVDLPDVDIDFEDRRRTEIKAYCEQRFGADRALPVGNYGTLKGKAAIKNVSRVFRVPISEAQQFCNTIVERSSADARASLTIEDTVKHFQEGRTFAAKYPQVVQYARALEGQIHHKGVHAAAMVLSRTPLVELLPVERHGTTARAIAWDGEVITKMGMLKMDLLGLRTLSIVQDTVRGAQAAGRMPGTFHIERDCPLDDALVLRKVSQGLMGGIFQLETENMSRLIAQMGGVRGFDDFAAINALGRPGCTQSGIAGTYVKIRRGAEPRRSYPDRKLNAFYHQLTADTDSVVLYQEQVMHAVREIGQFPWKDVTAIRTVMAKNLGPEKFDSMRMQFLKGAKAQGYDVDVAQRFWLDLITFGSWGFSKNHAYAYGLVSYWCAYLKTHYPEHFFAAVLNNSANEGRVAHLAAEMPHWGVSLGPPDINHAGEGYQVQGQKILIGLDMVKWLDVKTRQKIVAARPYASLAEFFDRVKMKRDSQKMRALVQAGAFDGLGYAREKVLAALPLPVLPDEMALRGRDAPERAYELSLAAGLPALPAGNEQLKERLRQLVQLPGAALQFDATMLKFETPYPFVVLATRYDKLNLRSRGKYQSLVVKGGLERELEKLGEDHVSRYLIFMTKDIGPNSGNPAIVDTDLLQTRWDWIFGLKRGAPIVYAGFKRAASNFVNIVALTTIADLRRCSESGEVASWCEPFFLGWANPFLTRQGCYLILERFERMTKDGRLFLRVYVLGSSGGMEVLFWPDAYDALGDSRALLRSGNVVWASPLRQAKGISGIPGLAAEPSVRVRLVHELGPPVGDSPHVTGLRPPVTPRAEPVAVSAVQIGRRALSAKAAEWWGRHRQQVLDCRACDMVRHCRRPVPPSPGQYAIMVVGRDPGEHEEEEGKGFVGPAGQKLWHDLAAHGIQRDMVWVNNVGKCRPARGTFNPLALTTCAPLHLRWELQFVRPTVVLVLGNEARTFFTGDAQGILDHSGDIVWCEAFQCWLVLCLHPAAVLRRAGDPAYQQAWARGLQRFAELVRRGVHP